MAGRYDLGLQRRAIDGGDLRRGDFDAQAVPGDAAPDIARAKLRTQILFHPVHDRQLVGDDRQPRLDAR